MYEGIIKFYPLLRSFTFLPSLPLSPPSSSPNEFIQISRAKKIFFSCYYFFLLPFPLFIAISDRRVMKCLEIPRIHRHKKIPPYRMCRNTFMLMRMPCFPLTLSQINDDDAFALTLSDDEIAQFLLPHNTFVIYWKH